MDSPVDGAAVEYVDLSGLRAALPELSYRQLDYWTRSGRIRATAPTPGSGYPRQWLAEDVPIARATARLTRLGFELAVGERLARAARDGDGIARTNLGPYVEVVLHPGLWGETTP